MLKGSKDEYKDRREKEVLDERGRGGLGGRRSSLELSAKEGCGTLYPRPFRRMVDAYTRPPGAAEQSERVMRRDIEKRGENGWRRKRENAKRRETRCYYT